MKQIIYDFFQLGTLRVIARVITGVRGLIIVTSLSPENLGQYAIWLLFVFYFSILDLGLLSGLERDVPHHRARKDEASVRDVFSTALSTFYCLSTLAAVLLAIVTFVVYRRMDLSLLLAGYLLTDRFYRSYYSNARILMRYVSAGIAELVLAVVSLAAIWILLPRLGPQAIFVGFIVGSLAGTVLLQRQCPLFFEWRWDVGKSFRYIKSAFSLAVIIYSIDVFHMTAMTVLAILWDKETLGYFAFAFKIFQICVSLFPFLIQEVMRTRMYYNVAAAGKGTGGAGNLVRPILAYGFITIAFWQVVFWWAPWAVAKCVPTYIDSVPALIILTLALMPLGVAKICTDFLCSRSILKSGSALKIWGSGIALQALLITFWPTAEDQILRNVPLFYLISALWIYFASFISVFKSEYPWWPRTVYAAVQCLVPVFAALAIVRLEKSVWHWIPGGYWLYNLPSFAVAIALSLGFAGLWVYAWTRWRSWNPFPQHF